MKKSDDEDNGTKESFTNESSNKTMSDNKKMVHIDSKEGKINDSDNNQKTKLTRDNLFQNLKTKGIPIEKKASVEKLKENFLMRKNLNLACYKQLINEKKLGSIDETLQMSKVKSILQNLQFKDNIKLSKPDPNK